MRCGRSSYKCFVPPFNPPCRFSNTTPSPDITPLSISLSGDMVSRNQLVQLLNKDIDKDKIEEMLYNDEIIINKRISDNDISLKTENYMGNIEVSGYSSKGLPICGIRFTITNTSDVIGDDIFLTIPVPPGSDLISYDVSQGTIIFSTKLVWSVGSLNPKQIATIDLVCRPGSIWKATICTSTFQTNIQNNELTISVP